MPRAKRKQNPEPVEYISLDDFVSDGSTPKVYANVKGDGMEDLGMNDGDLVVLYQRPAKAGEMLLVKDDDRYDIIPYDDPATRRQKFYIVGKKSANLQTSKAPDETLGVVAYVVRRMRMEVQHA